MRPDPNHVYDQRRCRTCGTPWPEHPESTICNRHRPVAAPHWVAEALASHERVRDAVCATASNLPAVADDVLKARREVVGGVPTREWSANGQPNGEGRPHA